MIVALMLSGITSEAAFDLTEDVRKAYQLTIELRLDEARQLCSEIHTKDPNNLLALYIEDYIDFFTILINEDEEEYKALEKKKKERIQKVKKGDQRSPYYRLILGEINLHWSLIRLKFNEKFKALREANDAYRYLTENQQIFPEFQATKKSLSIIHAMAESIPGIFKFFLAIDGSIEQGTQEIREVVEYSKSNDFLFKEEALAVYAYILYSQNNLPEQAWSIIQSSDVLTNLKSPLSTFIFAFFAQKTGRNELAIQYLRERPKSDRYFNFHYLDLMLGKSLLYKLDPEAKDHIDAYLENYKGKHYFKDAYQKLAWYEWVVNEDLVKYKYFMKQCLEIGEDLVDADKQALKEAKKKRKYPIPYY